MKWMSYDECLNVIRPYNLEKINIVKKIKKVRQFLRLNLNLTSAPNKF